jgi:hypothetical protein
MFMCDQLHYEITLLYNNIIMRNIQKMIQLKSYLNDIQN